MMNEAYIHLPHYEQSASGYCLPACARMVLTQMGLTYSELELSQALGTDDVGTPSFATLERKKRFSFLDWVRKVVSRD